MQSQKNLTKAQAMRAYRAIVKQFHPAWEAKAQPGPIVQGEGTSSEILDGGPVLYRDYGSWSSTTAWAVVWESGPDDWAYRMTGSGKLSTPGVYVEPIESFSVGLYPE